MGAVGESASESGEEGFMLACSATCRYERRVSESVKERTVGV